jgi:hypothetical protein
VRLTADLLVVSVARQQLHWYRRAIPLNQPSAARRAGGGRVVRPTGAPAHPAARLCRGYRLHRTFLASTSRFGVGQLRDSHQTPLGLHCVAEKIGAGWPIGTVFRARQPIGTLGQGFPHAPIAHRVLWLAGLEPGYNAGGEVDSRRRFIYLHGLADEPTLGRPASHGCVHLAAADLMPLFEKVRPGTLVWIMTGP